MASPVLAQHNNDDKPLVFKEGIILEEDALPPLIEIPEFPVTDFTHDEFAAAKAYRVGDYVQARAMASALSAEGNARAQTLLATMLHKGQGGTQDSPGAVQWYQKAAKNGEVYAWLALAEMAFANQGGLSVGDGRNFLRKAARSGSLDAQIVLAQVLASGLGGPVNTEKAKSGYRTAIHDGSVRAKRLLGDIYFSQNEDAEALALYIGAAREGDARSAYQAGIILADPENQFYDYAASAPLLKQAAMDALPEAMTAWAIFAISQEPPRRAEAARWLRKAAQADNGEGQYLYAIALAKGEGVQQDREAAYEWAVRAVRHDPQDNERRALAVALGSALPGPVRGRIEEIAEQSLLILSHTASP